MEIFWNFLLLTAGLVAVVKGADWLVDGASALAAKRGVSELTIGLTIVAFGTSAPELAVNIQGTADIVFGNTIGSNNFNILCILGISGLIYPLYVQRKTIFVEIPFSLLVVIIVWLLINDTLFGAATNMLSASDGIILLLIFGAFIFYVYKTSKNQLEVEVSSATQMPNPKVALFIVLGAAGLIIGGGLVVDNAQDLAKMAGVSDTMIALTIISLGTSLPELATSAVAAFKKRPDLAVGNVIGSNIFNMLLVLGMSSIVEARPYDKTLNADLVVLMSATVLLFAFMFIQSKKRLNRIEAFTLTLGFVSYMLYIINREIPLF